MAFDLVSTEDGELVELSQGPRDLVEQALDAGGLELERGISDLVEGNYPQDMVEDASPTGLLSERIQGPPGGGKASGGAVFIQDVVGVGGIVGNKEWNPSVPPQVHLAEATSDTAVVLVHVGAAGGRDYSPTVTVNDVPVILSESSTKRWFVGSAKVPLVVGENIITAKTEDGAKDTAKVFLAGPGPEVLGVSFGPYQGSQTELKSGDTISVTIATEPEAVELTVLVGGANGSSRTWPVTGGSATGTITISGASGYQPITVRAKNALGTYGTDHVSSDTLNLNQTYPTVSVISVSYPAGQGAFNEGEAGAINFTATSFDTISVTSPDLVIDAPTTYTPSKQVTNTRVGYVGSGSNITITANRAANNATTTRTGLARIATTPAKAAITINGNPARLISSPAGQDYEVRVTPDQTLAQAPELNASLGSWQGAWTLVGGYWRRTLRISDSTDRGVGVFSALSMVGLSGIVGSEITSGGTYVVGGMTQRTVIFPAFSRVAFLGASVADPTKTSAQVSGGNVLARQSSNAVVSNGYYTANADGGYNAQGAYLGLSDTAFAGANTTGTLAVIFQEGA